MSEDEFYPYEPDQWDSRVDYEEARALRKKVREEQRIFDEAVEKDPTIKIHLFPTVVHPQYEDRTAWLRPGNAFTEKVFRMMPMAALPPHEIVEWEKQQGMNVEPFITTSLLVNSPNSDSQDFPEKAEKLVRATFQFNDEPFELIIHPAILWLDRDLTRSRYGVELVKPQRT